MIQRTRTGSRVRHSAYGGECESTGALSDESLGAGDYEPLFEDVFGNGHEYDYVHAANEEGPSLVPERAEDTAVPDADCERCLVYVRTRLGEGLRSRVSEGVVGLFLKGHHAEYVALYGSALSIKEAYYVGDWVGEWRRKRPGLEHTEETEHSGSKSEERIAGLLTAFEYLANLKAKERVYEPEGEPVCGLEECRGLIGRIAGSETFKGLVNLRYETKLLGGKEAEIEDLLVRLFVADDRGGGNEFRRRVVEEAQRLVSVDVSGINDRLFLSGWTSAAVLERTRRSGPIRMLIDALDECNMKGNGKETRFSQLLSDLPCLTNAIVSLCGPAGSYAGLLCERDAVKIALIDRNGRPMGTAAFRNADMQGISAYLSNASTVCATAAHSSARYFIQRLGMRVLYVPYALSVFSGAKDFSVPANIAACIQNPFVYFSRIVYQNTGGMTVDQKSNYTSQELELVKRAIRTGLSIRKMDWRDAVSHQYGHALFHVLGLSLTDSYFDYGGVPNLAALSSVFSASAYANLTTYFVLADSNSPLDATPVHPQDYSLAAVLCKSACVIGGDRGGAGGAGSDSTDEAAAIRQAIGNLGLIRAVQLPEGAESLGAVKGALLSQPPAEFTGATDQQMFDDIVAELSGTVTGTVIKIGKGFYIAECRAAQPSQGRELKGCDKPVGTATVFLKTDCALSLNQTITVRITSKNLPTLSYNGELTATQQAQPDRFYLKHRLFRNTDHASLLRLMDADNCNVMARSSSEPGIIAVVCRLQAGIFLPIRLRVRANHDGSAPSFFHEGKIYQSLDSFIDDHVKKLYRTLYSVTAYAHFYKVEAAAIAYISEPSQYIRHAIVLSRHTPGCIEFLFANKRVLARLDASGLIYRDASFPSINAFIKYAKANFR